MLRVGWFNTVVGKVYIYGVHGMEINEVNIYTLQCDRRSNVILSQCFNLQIKSYHVYIFISLNISNDAKHDNARIRARLTCLMAKNKFVIPIFAVYR